MTEPLNNFSLRLKKKDIVTHPDHGEGEVINISEHPEYPVEVLFKDSPVVTRIKVPISLFFSLFGIEVSNRGIKAKRLTRVTDYA